MTQLKDKWTKQPQPSISEKFNDIIKPKGPLKPRVQTAIKKLSLQISKLDNMLTKLQERDGKLFQRIVEATQKHDTQTSKVLSNELAEVRKVTKILSILNYCKTLDTSNLVQYLSSGRFVSREKRQKS